MEEYKETPEMNHIIVYVPGESGQDFGRGSLIVKGARQIVDELLSNDEKEKLDYAELGMEHSKYVVHYYNVRFWKKGEERNKAKLIPLDSYFKYVDEFDFVHNITKRYIIPITKFEGALVMTHFKQYGREA